ncbi:MAG: HDIG domain-containing protein [Phycisphaerae bacterium]|nr:HDIG domain-containing protein [Phycisphaerae bacterium]
MARDERQRGQTWGDGGGPGRAAVTRAEAAGLSRIIRAGSGFFDWRRAARSPSVTIAVVQGLLFVVVVAAAVIWTREQPLLAVGRVLTETRAVRTPFEVVDEAATRLAKEGARQRTPRVYVANSVVLGELRASLEGLPRALADAPGLEGVESGIREQFALTEEGLRAVQEIAANGVADEAWRSRVVRLDEALRKTPVLDAATFQVESQAASERLELRADTGGPGVQVRRGAVVNAEGQQLAEVMRGLALSAGFDGDLLNVVTARLTLGARPTFLHDPATTQVSQEAAAARESSRTNTYAKGQIIGARGDTLSAGQLELIVAEERGHLATATGWERWAPRLGLAGLVAVVTIGLGAYLSSFCPKIARNPWRVWALHGLMAGALLVACWASSIEPWLVHSSAIVPSLFVSVILAVAYERRTALAIGSIHALLACLALEQSAAVYTLSVAGTCLAVWQLKDLRQRDRLIRMGLVTGALLALGTLIAGMLDRPMVASALRPLLWDAGSTGLSALMVGFVTLGVLPTVERTFGITTGMTLIELRDPSHPLLRELQRRAPGTYNHSLNVASLSEAAAESIGANGLLAYVGSLYHDVGKMNKPEYFVENQTHGFNRHDKLTPALSLLVIVGHVKDGVELAREFDLPRPVLHFIEAHHGTTLVEYFFREARRRAEAQKDVPLGEALPPAAPTEIEYRYPGPKPRHREVAVVMVCDAAESAARALSDPTPSRLESLVRTIAHKRLMDGQFDECDLTLRDLSRICDAVSRSLAALHHARVAYPESGSAENESLESPTGT